MEFSPKRKNISFGKCCVPQCNSRRDKDVTLSFHKLQKSGAKSIIRVNPFGKTEKVDQFAEWSRLLNIKTPNNENQEQYVCSKHFKADDYHLPDIHAMKRYLKRNAVPITAKISAKKTVSNLKRTERAKNPENKLKSADSKKPKIAAPDQDNNIDKPEKQIREPSVHLEIPLLNDKIQNELENTNEDRINQDLELVDSTDECEECQEPIVEYKPAEPSTDSEVINIANDTRKKNVQFIDKSVEVKSGDLAITFINFIKTESNLMTFCNIKSFAILDEITKLMNEIYKKKENYLLSTRDCIILTTMKLKLDIPFNALVLLFRVITSKTVGNIFYDTLKKLATILRSCIRRVSKEEIMQNMPKCFEKFQGVTSVLDCIEVYIQQPKCLKCRIKFYSHYKKGLTIKYMTEVTPGGIIVGISDTFGGRASDKTIFNHTGTLRHLHRGENELMVDREFTDRLLRKIKNKEIAKARVLNE